MAGDDTGVIASQNPVVAGCYPQAGSPCAAADFVCLGNLGWRCDYSGEVETDADGVLVVVESRCDGFDGNCNGQADEAWLDIGEVCDDGVLARAKMAG